MKKFPYFIITFIFAVLFLSCSDLSNSKGTYLVFSSKSRALEKSAEYLTDITLEGKSSAGTLNNTWKTASEFLSSRIEIEAGSWEFTLTAYLKETEYKASTTAQIIAGLENKVTFKLAAVATNFVYLSTGDEIFSDKYESITEAVSAIEDAENCTDWIIYINGEITGTNHVYIGESCASSITITGSTGNTSDILNGNEEGTVLSISTSVPVIIKNLKITGGTGTVSGGYTSAGGIYIGQAATVTLAENTIITGNTVGIDANGKYGGGVYNAGKLFMYGSALIGDSSKTELPTAETNSNSAYYGGGLYNNGSAYLGYSGINSVDETLIEAELTGGIYYNYGADGAGAIFNAGTLYINSGNINYNYTASWGGGIRTSESNSVITLSGGTISNNANNNSMGGGVIVRGGTFTMSGGEISSNTAATGGGISITDAVFTMTGGSIKNNTSDNLYYERGNGATIGETTLSEDETITSNIINAEIQTE